MFAGVFFFFFFGLSLLYFFSTITVAPNDRMFPNTLEESGSFLYALKTLFS